MNVLPIYFIAITAAALLGGKLSSIMTMTHLRMQIMMSLIAGFIMGMALHHLLPHSMEYIAEPNAWERASSTMLMGIILMVLLLQIFNFHQHEIPHSADTNPSVRPAGLWGIITGLAIHSTVEGAALGAGILSNPNGMGGLGIFLVILLHKPLDAWTVMGLMKSSNLSPSVRTLVTVLFSLVTPIAMALTYWGIGVLSNAEDSNVLGYIMAFASGTFLCIALSDLLPEIQFHRHDRGKLTFAFFGGIVLSYILRLLESP